MKLNDLDIGNDRQRAMSTREVLSQTASLREIHEELDTLGAIKSCERLKAAGSERKF